MQAPWEELEILPRVQSSHLYVEGRHVVDRPRPVNLKDGDRWLFQHELRRTFAPRRVVSFSSGTLVENGGIVINGRPFLPSDGRPLSFRAQLLRARFLAAFAAERWSRSRPSPPTAWIVDPWSTNYFHWLMDALPRLLLVLRVRSEVALVLPRRYQSIGWIRSSLEAITPLKIQFFDAPAAVVDDVIVPDYAAPTGNYDVGLVRFLRNRFRTYFASGLKVPTRRLYISRHNADRRRLVQETAILRAMERAGFELVFPEMLSFAEQVRLFASAACVVGNHGAGLTNILFMPPGGRVLELRRSGDAVNNCYFALAGALELRYYYQLCEPQGVRLDPRARDLRVDLGELQQNLAALVNTT